MYKFEDIKENDNHSFSFNYSRDFHEKFAEISGDSSSIHTSSDFANKNSFANVIGYSFALTTFLSNIYGMNFPGGSELCLYQDCKFRNPFFIGDKLTLTIVVTQKVKQGKLINISLKFTNQDSLLIMDGRATFSLVLSE